MSQAFLGGASEEEIRDWVGHRDSRIIERYRHLRDTESRRKMEQLDFLGAEPPSGEVQRGDVRQNASKPG